MSLDYDLDDASSKIRGIRRQHTHLDENNRTFDVQVQVQFQVMKHLDEKERTCTVQVQIFPKTRVHVQVILSGHPGPRPERFLSGPGRPRPDHLDEHLDLDWTKPRVQLIWTESRHAYSIGLEIVPGKGEESAAK